MPDIIMWRENEDAKAIGSSDSGRKEIGDKILGIDSIPDFLATVDLKLVIALIDSKNLVFLEQSDLH
jgi:hypothetical protein